MATEGRDKRISSCAGLLLTGVLAGAAGLAASRYLSAAPEPRTPLPAAGQEVGFPDSSPGSKASAQISHKQRREIIKENFEKMKRDAEELSSLAKALQEDLDKSSENVLSLQIVEKAEKIEKLAKRIKGTAKGS
ncbi:MAG: hypothetical protein ACE145_09400 [Terriglobia bacterium]